MNNTTGKEQIKEIISEMLDLEDFPTFDFLNNVLSSKKILGNYELWLHWGNLLIHHSVDDIGKNAGEHYILEDWNTENDGTITLIKGKKLGDVI